jgi:asparagine N-glycosylation enzyme membrane subunit Stt3
MIFLPVFFIFLSFLSVVLAWRKKPKASLKNVWTIVLTVPTLYCFLLILYSCYWHIFYRGELGLGEAAMTLHFLLFIFFLYLWFIAGTGKKRKRKNQPSKV